MIKFRAAMVSVLVSLFVLTGCGGGEESLKIVREQLLRMPQ
jgi:hypothetical protein